MSAVVRRRMELPDPLSAGLDALGVRAGPHEIERLNAYVDLLMQWNRAHRLTADAPRAGWLARHVLDSAAALRFLPAGRGPLLDAGSGGGLPGLVLALLRPGSNWVLLDSSARKVAFLRHARAQLRLRNVEVVRSRLEDYDPQSAPNALTARGLAPLPRLVEWASHLLRRGAWLVAMLGRRPADAQLRALKTVQCRVLEPVCVPGLQAARHIAVFEHREDADGSAGAGMRTPA
ncbi:16S rRNA (guanine(527)-N(7))-methyltransferase RsmG [Candidatus Foliamicus sp.]